MHDQPLPSPVDLTPNEAKQFLQLIQAHRTPQGILSIFRGSVAPSAWFSVSVY